MNEKIRIAFAYKDCWRVLISLQIEPARFCTAVAIPDKTAPERTVFVKQRSAALPKGFTSRGIPCSRTKREHCLQRSKCSTRSAVVLWAAVLLYGCALIHLYFNCWLYTVTGQLKQRQPHDNNSQSASNPGTTLERPR